MTIEEYWDHTTNADKATFQRVCRYLLKQTFIVRDRDENHRRMYSFISRNADFFNLYFSYLGFEAALVREDGVAMLRNLGKAEDSDSVQTNHLKMRKIDSIILCALWTLYSDRLREGKLSRVYEVTVTDLSFALEKFGLSASLDKTTLRDSLTLFSRYNLLGLSGNIGDPDCVIILYPSMQFALQGEGFREFAENAARRMLQNAPAGDALLSEEDDDE